LLENWTTNIDVWASALALGLMAALTKEIGFKTNDMVLENGDLQKDKSSKDPGLMMLNMVTVDLHIKTATLLNAHGSTIDLTV
jgi:hypothetical protein